MLQRFLAVLSAPILVCCAFVSGCGYHTVNSAVHLPSNVRTLAVPAFKNNTQSYHTQAVFTEAVIKEFNSRTSYRVISGDDPDADATLRGTITAFAITPLTYDNTTGQTSTFLVTISAKLELVDKNQKVLWQNASYTFREQYEQVQDLASFIQEDSPATRRLAKAFAAAAVGDILESF